MLADPSAEELDRLHAATMFSSTVRLLATALPATLEAVLPPNRVQVVERYAAQFSPARTAVPTE